MNHECPVCGYDRLELPPLDYSICPCCGTEFGASDRILTYEQLRDTWINSGCIWFDTDEPRPVNWNPFEQLRRAGLAGPFATNSADESIFFLRIGKHRVVELRVA